MAINTSNRVLTTGLTKLEKEDYLTKIDMTEFTSLYDQMSSYGSSLSGSLSDLTNFDINSLLNNYTGVSIKDRDISYESMSQFDNPFCSQYPSLNVRMPTYNNSLFRDLDLTFNMTVCGKTKTVNPVDYIMKASSFVMNNPGIFSSDSNTRLRALLSSDLVRKLNIAGLGTVIPDCILEKTGGFLSTIGSSYGSGGSMSIRQALDDLLSKDKCARLVASQVGLYDTLSSINNIHFLNMMINGDLTRAETYFAGVLGIGYVTSYSSSAYSSGYSTTYSKQAAIDEAKAQRTSLILGYSRSFTEEYAYNDTYNKLVMFNSVYDNGFVQRDDKVYFTTSATDILDSLANDETDNKDLDAIEKALDYLSPEWNKDEEGNTNLYKTNGNEVMAVLANNKLIEAEPAIDLDGVYETILDNEHHIAIINTFAEAS